MAPVILSLCPGWVATRDMRPPFDRAREKSPPSERRLAGRGAITSIASWSTSRRRATVDVLGLPKSTAVATGTTEAVTGAATGVLPSRSFCSRDVGDFGGVPCPCQTHCPSPVG